jgi:hypothetical protein
VSCYPDIYDIIKFRKSWKNVEKHYKKDNGQLNHYGYPITTEVFLPQESAYNFMVNSITYIDKYKFRKELVELKKFVNYLEYMSFNHNGNSAELLSMGSCSINDFDVDAFQDAKTICNVPIIRYCMMKSVIEGNKWYEHLRPYIIKYKYTDLFGYSKAEEWVKMEEIFEKDTNNDNHRMIRELVRISLYFKCVKKCGKPGIDTDKKYFYDRLEKIKEECIYALRKVKTKEGFRKVFVSELLSHAHGLIKSEEDWDYIVEMMSDDKRWEILQIISILSIIYKGTKKEKEEEEVKEEVQV